MAITVTLTPSHYLGGAGESVVFTAVVAGLAAGETADSYTWKKGGVAISGAVTTVPTYTLNITDAASVGDFSVTVQVSDGSALTDHDSNSVPIAFGVPLLAPKSTPATFSEYQQYVISATATMPTAFHWYRYEWWIDGVHDASLDSLNAAPKTITIAEGSATDANKKYVLKAVYDTEEVNALPRTASSVEFSPTFASLTTVVTSGQTANKTSGRTGDTITITAVFDHIPSGLSIVGYTWKKDGVLIPGANATSYVVNVTNAASVGVFTCTAKIGLTVAKSVEVINTTPTTITYLSTPVITIAADKTSVEDGDVVSFTSTVTNAPAGHTAQAYQWKKSGVDIAGKTSATLNVTVDSTSLGSYTLAVKVGADLATAVEFLSNAVVLTQKVVLNPIWTVHPIPWRLTSFTPLGYWVLDEILYQKALGKDWKVDYASYRYHEEVATLLDAFNKNGECEVQDSRNGYIHKMSEI